jgi:hypothetical protein
MEASFHTFRLPSDPIAIQISRRLWVLWMYEAGAANASAGPYTATCLKNFRTAVSLLIIFAFRVLNGESAIETNNKISCHTSNARRDRQPRGISDTVPYCSDKMWRQAKDGCRGPQFWHSVSRASQTALDRPKSSWASRKRLLASSRNLPGTWAHSVGSIYYICAYETSCAKNNHRAMWESKLPLRK